MVGFKWTKGLGSSLGVVEVWGGRGLRNCGRSRGAGGL